MITVTNISDIRLLPNDAYNILEGFLERTLVFPDKQKDTNKHKEAVFSHNVPCFQYSGIYETKHVYVLVNYGDQRWLDELAARFPSHMLTLEYDARDNMWVRVEKVKETPDCVSSRVLHAVRMLSSEFSDARLRAGNPPTTWTELFIACFRYGQIKYHLPWSTSDKYWPYLFPNLYRKRLEELKYYDMWIPRPDNFYYETIDFIAAATWKRYHQGVRKTLPHSPLLLHPKISYNTRLPLHRIIKTAVELYQNSKEKTK